MKLGIKVVETSPPACFSPTPYRGTEGQQLCAQAVFGKRGDHCWQCIYGERRGIRVNG